MMLRWSGGPNASQFWDPTTEPTVLSSDFVSIHGGLDFKPRTPFECTHKVSQLICIRAQVFLHRHLSSPLLVSRDYMRSMSAAG